MTNISGLLRFVFTCVFVSVSVCASAWWNDHGKHYGKIVAEVAPTGHGTVYLDIDGADYPDSRNNPDITIFGGQNTGLAYVKWQCFEGDEDGEKDYDDLSIPAVATPEAEDYGWYFKGWYGNEDGKGDAITSNYKATLTGSVSNNATNDEPNDFSTYYAVFAPVAVTGVTPTPITITPEIGVLKTTETITFTVEGSQYGLNDFVGNGPVIQSTNGDGEWKVIDIDYADNKVTCKVTYTAKSYTKSDGSPTDKATLTLTSKGDDNSQECELSASFEQGLSAGVSSPLTLRHTATSVTGSATFDVTNIDKADAIKGATFSESGWSYSGASYDAGTDKMTVNYTYSPERTALVGDHTATMTVTTQDGHIATVEVKCTIEPYMKEKLLPAIYFQLPASSAIETATIEVAHISDANTITAAITNQTGGTWTVGTIAFDGNEEHLPLRTLNVPFTFEASAEGKYSATLTLTPTGYAAQTFTLEADVVSAEDNSVASVTQQGGTAMRYESWETALAAANDSANSTLALIQDVKLGDLAATQTINNSFILDLNGKKLSANINGKDAFLTVANGYTLIIQDSRSTGAINTSGTGAAINVESGATLIINGITITANGETDVYGVKNNGTTAINNTTITATATNTGAYAVQSTNNLITYGGTFTAQATNNGTARVFDINGGKAVIDDSEGVINNTATNAIGINVGNNTTVTATNISMEVTVTGDNVSGVAVADDNAASLTLNNAIITVDGGLRSNVYALAASVKGSLTVNDGKYKAPTAEITANGTAGKTIINAGYFVHNSNLEGEYIPEGKSVQPVPTGAIKTAGYEYYIFTAPTTSTPIEGGSSIVVCKIGDKEYTTLEEALHVVKNGETIIMINNYTLPAGNYILPANTTLLVPYEGQKAAKKDNPDVTHEGLVLPTAEITLIFAKEVNFTLLGSLEAGAKLYAGDSGNRGTIAGTYGHIVLNDGARIDVENGAVIYAWGFITGTGLVNVKRGGKSYEVFQIGDFKGGTATSKLDNRVFPLAHYFYQNIECTIIYRAGAQAFGTGCVYATKKTHKVSNVRMVGEKDAGDKSLFQMEGGADGEVVYIKRTYAPGPKGENKDTIHWYMNSDTELASIKVSLSVVDVTSSNYILPLTNNMKITINSGTLNCANNAFLMPGAELIINKEATLSIAKNKGLYVVDKTQWQKAVKEESPFTTAACDVFSMAPYYSPTYDIEATRIKDLGLLPSAKVEVHGTIEVHGSLFTTESGANICSTNDYPGKVIFASDWTKQTDTLHKYKCNDGENTDISFWKNEGCKYFDYPVTSAQLRNGDNSVTNTAKDTAAAKAGDTYFYKNGQWIKMNDGCLIQEIGNATTNYIRPSGLIQVNNGNTDDTYSKADDATRTFINTEGKTSADACVWWEVTKDKNGYYASDNRFTNYGTYYEYNSDSGYWVPQMIHVTWLNEGTVIKDYDFQKGMRPVFLEATPAKAKHKWVGWTDQDGVYYDRNDELPRALTDMTFTAVFKKNQHRVIFKDEDGTILQNSLVEEDLMPVCENIPAPKIVDEGNMNVFNGWSPALTAVTGPATYTATYLKQTRTYPVTFQNYDGTLLHKEEVAYHNLPTYQGAPPTRPSNDLYSYAFKGWKRAADNSITNKNQSLPGVKGEETYTAVFEQVERADYGEMLDIVNAEAGKLVINMNGYTSPSAQADWTIEVLNDDNTLFGSYNKENRDETRLLTITLPTGKVADSKVKIRAKGKDGVIESLYSYTVPYVFTTNSNVGAMANDNSSVIFVKSGTLTINANTSVAAIYVAPGAELVINSGVTLNVGKLVLRTNNSGEAAILTDNGTLNCTKMYYSRVSTDNNKAYPIALPFDIDLTKVTLSNGKTAALGQRFGLLYYNAQRRATEGTTTGENWETVTSTTLSAQTAYQLISSSAYYMEFLFPVTNYMKDGSDEKVKIIFEKAETANIHWGWNGICSPYTGRYIGNVDGNPENAIKISEPDASNTEYSQRPIANDEIKPATMFFYQAAYSGDLFFGDNIFKMIMGSRPSNISARVEETQANVPTQWIQLFATMANGQKDQTNIYLHPDKFTMSYNLGYDVEKLSTSGTSPFMWTALPYGDMAFAALPEEEGAKGIALSLFAPIAGEMTLSIRENNWMDRLMHLYLIDNQENTQVDLLQEDYTWMAQTATYKGRFYLYPIMKAPSQGDIVTDNPTITETEGLVAYGINKNIIVANVPVGCTLRCYDMAGKLVASSTANAEQIMFAVPIDGLYFIHADNGVCKVMVK